jgi:Xaa-Pro dipeptidase
MELEARVPLVPPFPTTEFHDRVERMRRAMRIHELDAVLLTSEANVEYLSGFWTLFAWNSLSRPWYFVLPLDEEPIGVIPEFGESNWRNTSWVERLVVWPSPRPEDEGISLLVDIFRGLRRRFGRIGAELGPETRLGMPVADFLRLSAEIRPLQMVDATAAFRQVRQIKSPAEVERVATICRIADEAFAALPSYFVAGESERALAQKFQADLILRGAEKTPYVAMSSGLNGYLSGSTWPGDRVIAQGDVVIIDTGSRLGGYFCDFNRNFAVGRVSDEVRRAQAALVAAASAGIAAARPGTTMSELFHIQLAALESRGMSCGPVGRFGHGLGKLMTEWPSIKSDDCSVLLAGMIITIEPSVLLSSGRPMLHEEDIVITSDGCRVLTRRAEPELLVLSA